MFSAMVLLRRYLAAEMRLLRGALPRRVPLDGECDALACELSPPLFAQYREKELAVAGGRSALSLW